MRVRHFLPVRINRRAWQTSCFLKAGFLDFIVSCRSILVYVGCVIVLHLNVVRENSELVLGHDRVCRAAGHRYFNMLEQPVRHVLLSAFLEGLYVPNRALALYGGLPLFRHSGLGIGIRWKFKV